MARGVRAPVLRRRPGGALEPARAVLRIATAMVGAGALAMVIVTPLDLRSQAALAAAMFALSLALGRSRGPTARLALVLLSVTATARYLWWRITATVFLEWSADAALGFVLLAAELYSCAMLVLAYVQSVAPLRRLPVPLPDDRSRWPTVDVLIPTYNEPLEVVRTTVLAALALDWPRDRLRVFLLDDGRRPAFRAFSSEAGVGYLTRQDNAHAKAGNLNHALKHTRGEYIAIFDCDHVPTRSFLQVTMGGFLRDARLALVQTPHHFYSPDPFVRNLGLPPSVPSENELFYGVIQRGLDTWNAAFFCGSCAVLRRSALEEVGGIAVETVTEDAHTALKMHRRGWRSAYLDIPQAAGLSTESLSAHVGQRIRWARGMAQMFRIDNPLTGPGLRLSQRLSYLAAMLHFFSGVPRLVFLTAPIAYLLFGRHVFNALPLAALAYGFPHILHSTATNAHLHGRFRHSFWSEVYETSLAWYISIPTTLALLAPSAGRFNVTAKGGRIEEPFFDARIALPYLGLAALNLVALGAAARQLWLGFGEVDALAINVAWTIHNLVILSATLAVACERRQLRRSARVAARLPALLRPAHGRAVQCRTVDLSRGGASLEMSWRQGACAHDEEVSIALLAAGGDARAWLPAHVVSDEESTVRLRFAPLDLAQESELVRAIFSRPDAWSSCKEALRPDRPLATLVGIFRYGLLGAGRALRLSARAAAPRRSRSDHGPEPFGEEEERDEVGGGGRRRRLRITLFVVAAALAGSPARAQQTSDTPQAAAVSTRMLALGPTDEQRLSRSSVLEFPFATRADEDPAGARVKVAFAKEIAPEAPGVAAVEVVLNDQRAGFVEAAPGREATVALDPALLAPGNLLTLRLLDADGRPVAQRGAWVELSSMVLYLDTTTSVLPNDLALLPLPFIDRGVDTEAAVPIALPAPATPERARLAALVASWIALDSPIPVTFTVSVGGVPDGRAVVLVDDVAQAASLGLAPLDGPLVRMTDHPRRAASSAKLLVVGGRTPAELRAAVESLVARPERLVGQEVRLQPAPPSPPAPPYSAPRWLPPGRTVKFRDLPLAGTPSHDGATSATLSVRFRVAPDLAIWPADSIVMDLGWSERLPPGVAAPRLDVELNGYFLTTLPPPPGPGEIARELRLWIPREHLRGFNELLLHVKYPDGPGRGGPAGAGAGARVAISGDSALHLEGIGQFATLPDTGTFAYDGYPFTRVPDLGETAVVLPRDPGGAELSAALTLVAQFAQITGRVGTRASFVTVDDGDAALAGKDVLAIGTAADQPLIGRWRARWPLDVTAQRARVQAPSGGPGSWLELAGGLGRVLDRRRAEAVLEGSGEVGAVMGIESPLSPGRCVVAVTGTPGSTLPPFREFLGYAESRNLTGHDLLLLSGGRRFTFRIGPSFTRGHLDPWNRVRWFLADHWLLLVPVLIVGVAALGLPAGGALRARMRERLALGGGSP